MELIGITIEEFKSAVAAASENYGGNLVIHDDAKAISGKSSRGRVTVLDSRGWGARRSWSGRHGKWACWHAYRDVMEEIFNINSDARLRTSLAVYDGLDGFRENYPATAYKNIGSMMQPAYMPQLCDCRDENY